jgi:hypothetical protein
MLKGKTYSFPTFLLCRKEALDHRHLYLHYLHLYHLHLLHHHHHHHPKFSKVGKQLLCKVSSMNF